MENDHRMKPALLHVRRIEQIKAAHLGQCYSNLGNVIWQILSEIHLHEIDGEQFSGRDLARTMLLPESLAKRLVALLAAEGLIELSENSESTLDRHLSLSQLGVSKVTHIITESADELSLEIYATDAKACFAQI